MQFLFPPELSGFFQCSFIPIYPNIWMIFHPHDSLLSTFQHSVCPHQPIFKYLPAGGPPVIFHSRCLNGKMLKDMTDSSGDEGCYGYSKTDAHTDGCPRAYLQELGSGAVDRWVIIIAILHLLIRASLILFLSLVPFSFSSPHLAAEADKLIR